MHVNIPIDTSISESRQMLETLALKLAREWFEGQCNNTFAYYYLYYRPSDVGVPGQLVVNTEAPDGFQLADTERLSPGWTVEKAKSVIYQAIYTLPILPR
jgi:hypothetical protein